MERAALVTGAASGIGRAVALRLLADGFHVAIVDSDVEALMQTEASLDQPDRLIGLDLDVGADDAAEAAVERATARFGRLDALVNNAGIMIARPLGELTIEEWRRVLDVNLTSAFLFSKAAAEALRETRGAIVNIVSTRAMMSEPDTEAYAASKGGLAALSHALAISLAPDVRVNAVSPGWIDIEGGELREVDHAQHPVGRVGRPSDVAEIVSYLLDGARAGFVTGQNLVIDGGMTRKMIYAD